MKANLKTAQIVSFLLRWLPVTGSVTLMLMTAIFSALSFSQLRTANFWRDHTYQVLATGQTLLSDLFKIRAAARTYVFRGLPADLLAFEECVNTQELIQLKLLTRDNRGQQERLRLLSADLDNMIAYSQQLVAARSTEGIQAAIAFDSNGNRSTSMAQTFADLRTFTDEEQRLLTIRSATAEVNLNQTKLSLVFGSILAALLLVLAGLMAGRAIARQKELTHRARAAELAKSEFLAIMSHEIRTPMNGVIGMTSILIDTELDGTQRDWVNTINTSGESLMAVINDILDFSKIESGRMKLERRSFNVRDCVEEALNLFAAEIRIKGLEAVYLVAGEVPSHLIGDAMRLRQILVNFIGNAVKFTSKGEIAINVECQGQREKAYELLFSVTDTGIGISTVEIEKLFKAFQQGDTSTARRYGGTGLGLVISKHLAEFMGGEIWVESEPGSGSTFFLSVTLGSSEAAVPAHQSAEPGVLGSHSVLIVEDNATNRRILEIQLKIWGMKPTSTANGSDGLRKMAEQDFDVILIDFQMPEMDGVALARAIRKRSLTPMILLSSSGEAIKGEDADLFEAQIAKPIRHSTLFNALISAIGTEPDQPRKTAGKKFADSMATNHPLRILLAEDNIVNQQVGLLMLSKLGYQADLAADGQAALDAVENGPYDLILMDIQMPKMNGIDAARLIREKLGAKCPAMIALTAEAFEGDKQRFLGLGFDDYLSKPVQVQMLRNALKDLRGSADGKGGSGSASSEVVT